MMILSLFEEALLGWEKNVYKLTSTWILRQCETLSHMRISFIIVVL